MSNDTQPQDSPSSWKAYYRAGRERAMKLGNRGPMRFDENGRLEQDILDAYYRCGFYVFTGVLSSEEVDELKSEFDQLLDNAPIAKDGEIDKHGRPVKFAGYYSLSSDELFKGQGTDQKLVQQHAQ